MGRGLQLKVDIGMINGTDLHIFILYIRNQKLDDEKAWKNKARENLFTSSEISYAAFELFYCGSIKIKIITSHN